MNNLRSPFYNDLVRGIHNMDVIHVGELVNDGKSELLQELNMFVHRDMNPEDVFIFEIKLCDNDIDKDFQCFATSTLVKMQEMYIGETGLVGDSFSEIGQTARIFKTMIKQDSEKLTRYGVPYVELRAFAYMIRTSSNKNIIEDIETGRKKECSISCSVSKKFCSICNKDNTRICCGHLPGIVYDNKLCYQTLCDLQDVYEWEFVKHFDNET